MAKTYFLKLTSAIALEGVICRAGEIVEVGELEAKNFLGRNKATLATAEELKAAGIELPDDPEGNDGEDLSKLKKDELLVVAKKRGVDIGDGATKAQIIEAINAAAAAGGDNQGE